MDNQLLRFWRPFAIAWVAFGLLGAAWSFATPIGAAPDEPAHLIRAASVATGQLAPFLTNESKVHVPEYVFHSQDVTCFAGAGDSTPRCVPADKISPTATATVYASSGRYNPLYYALVGWPSLLLHSDAGIYAMRLASDVIVSLFVGLSFGLIATWRRPTLPIIGLATAMTPMVLFLNGVVNPNTLEISATLATFVGMLSIVREPSPRLLAPRAAIVFVAASVAANMRGLSLLWIAVAILVPLIFVTRSEFILLLRTRAIRLAILGSALTFVAALVWSVVADPIGLSDPAATGTLAPQGVGTSHLLGFIWTFFSTFYYGQQVIGVFGWLAVPAPAAVYFIWSLFVGALALLSFVLLRGRSLGFVGAVAAALIFFPPILQGIYVTDGGVIWQGRYILPLFACACVGFGAALSDRIVLAPSTAARLLLIIGVVWAAGQFLAFATTLKRYSVGISSEWPSILHPIWSPPGGALALLGTFGVLVLAAVFGLVAWHRLALLTRPSEPDEVDGKTSDGPSDKRRLNASEQLARD